MDWFYTTSDPLKETLLASIIIFVAIIILTRVIGLRSFAKFTVTDFAFTVAIGSIISSTLTSSTTVLHGSVAIGSLLVITFLVSFLQRRFALFKKLISNKPLLLMENGEILNKNLKHARIDKEQLVAKLREANVLNYSQVLAVVLESTGDISVIHKSASTSEEDFDSDILLGVRRTP